MKNKALILTLALCMMLFGAVYSHEEEQISTISVDASTNTDIEPDTVKIKFWVENTGLNLSDLKAKNDKIVNSAIGEIKKRLKENESVNTVAFRVNNVYSYKNSVRIFQKYSVTNGFEVKLKELSKTSEIIKIAMDQGIKRVDNLNFYIENSQKTCNDLMAQAAKIAKNRAEVVSAAAGASLGKVKTINPYCSINSNYVTRNVYSNALMAKQATGATDMAEEAVESIEPGTIGVRAGVNITYYLK